MVHHGSAYLHYGTVMSRTLTDSLDNTIAAQTYESMGEQLNSKWATTLLDPLDDMLGDRLETTIYTQLDKESNG